MPANLDALQKKLYGLIISRIDGDMVRMEEYRRGLFDLVHKGIGGFIIFGGERDEIRKLVRDLQSSSDLVLFICSDIERGVQQQIGGTTAFPCQMAMAAAIDPVKPGHVELLQKAIRSVMAEAKHVGINMPLIPVMDVNSDPDNPIICTRAFSDNPGTTVWFGTEYIKAVEAEGLISCAKHFPGHGDTAVDSHISLPVINKPMSELMKCDVMPFKKSIEAGTGSIMVGHLTVSALDTRPASLSEKVITGLLRKELGFEGLVLTDALNMNALKGFGNVPACCVNAGADIILHPTDADAAAMELLSSVRSGEVGQDGIEAAFSRVIKAKSRLSKDLAGVADFTEGEALSRLMTEMSITLVRNNGVTLPLANSSVHAIFAGETGFHNSSPLKESFYSTTASETADISGDVAIFAVFTSVSAWKGSSGISMEEKEKIKRLIQKAKTAVVISFGSPYVLRYFIEADMLIAAYEPGINAQYAVIKCLSGTVPFSGRLPVTLPETG